MNALLQNLLKLQALDFEEVTVENAETAKAELRAQIPEPILGHYTRLVARDKKGVAIVRNQVCTGCHMRLPMGVIMTLMRGEDIQLCDNCGRYLCLPAAEAEPKPAEEPVAAAKPAKKPRKRKTPAATA